MRGLSRTMGVFILIFHILSTSHAQTPCPEKYKGQPPWQTVVRIASVSIYPEKWNKDENWIRIENRVCETVEKSGAQMVITPEGVLEGYVINEVNREVNPETKSQLLKRFRELAEPLDGPYIHKARVLADQLNIFLVLGFLERRDKSLMNSAILIDPDGDIIGRYSKTHFAQGYTINPSDYRPGDEYPVFDTPFGKVGILICYDRQLPENTRILALKGAQIFLIPSYGSIDDGDGWNTRLLQTRAYENRCALVFTHPEQSLLISNKGALECIGGRDESVWYDVDTDPEKIKGRFKNRRPELYAPIADTDS